MHANLSDTRETLISGFCLPGRNKRERESKIFDLLVVFLRWNWLRSANYLLRSLCSGPKWWLLTEFGGIWISELWKDKIPWLLDGPFSIAKCFDTQPSKPQPTHNLLNQRVQYGTGTYSLSLYVRGRNRPYINGSRILRRVLYVHSTLHRLRYGTIYSNSPRLKETKKWSDVMTYHVFYGA